MATITTQTIKVDLTPGRVYPVLHVSQGDVGLEALEFHIYQNNQPYPIPSQVTTINIDGMTSVGVFSYPCTWSGNVVTAGLTATMTAEKGVDICELALYDATNNKIGTCNFVIAVEESPYTNAHVSTSDMATIMAAATEVQQNTLLSKSWAVGDTGIRTGENTNNSEYWAEISKSWAVGDTGKRTGEDTNNSEYWSTISHQYANTISFKTYDTVAQMKADTGILDGGVCRTLGYYTANDGGGSFYKITETLPTVYYETLSNGLYAVLIHNGTVNTASLGDITLSKINAILDDVSVYAMILSGSVEITEPIIIERSIIIISNNFLITQKTWGYPGIIVLADNVHIYGTITITCDVLTRTPVTSGYYPEDTSDPKADSAGIMLGHNDTHSNFYAERVIVYNFIAGIVNLSNGFSDINIGYLYVENVDFGIFGAHYINTVFDDVEFKDISSYEGSTDPSHVIYLTGGSTADLSYGVIVNHIYGDGCNSKLTDSVFSIKSTKGFYCNNGIVDNISWLATAMLSTGGIKDIHVGTATGAFGCQSQNTDFAFDNISFESISIMDTHLIYCVSAKMRVNNCRFNVEDDTRANGYVYISSSAIYDENDNEYISPSDSVATLFMMTGTSLDIDIKEPKANIPLYAQTGTISFSHVRFLLNPARLSYPKTNGLVPGLAFVPNDYIADESSNYPSAFRTNNNVRVSNAQNIAYFNTNNATNGIVYTLYNGGNANIIAGTRIKTKSGGDYLSANWNIFRFMNIGNVAYEI